MIVLLPLPDGPTSATVCPGYTVKVTSLIICFLWKKIKHNTSSACSSISLLKTVQKAQSIIKYMYVGGKMRKEKMLSISTLSVYERRNRYIAKQTKRINKRVWQIEVLCSKVRLEAVYELSENKKLTRITEQANQNQEQDKFPGIPSAGRKLRDDCVWIGISCIQVKGTQEQV